MAHVMDLRRYIASWRDWSAGQWAGATSEASTETQPEGPHWHLGQMAIRRGGDEAPLTPPELMPPGDNARSGNAHNPGGGSLWVGR